MIGHHTKTKGDLGVLKAKCDLLGKGYLTFSPDTEHAPFDVVAYKDGKFVRVQVKYRSKDNLGALSVSFKTSWSDKHGYHPSYYEKSSIDLFCVYCPDTDKCYYFDPKLYNRSVKIRIDPPLNKQTQNVKFAEDFLEIPETV